MLPSVSRSAFASRLNTSVAIGRQPRRCIVSAVSNKQHAATPTQQQPSSICSALGNSAVQKAAYASQQLPQIARRRRSGLVCQAAAAALPLSEEPSGFSKFLANVRACLFTVWTFTLAVPLFVVMCIMALPVLTLDKYRRLAQHFVNNLWAMASTTPFYSVEVVGKENLPKSSTPAVYVANHQSFMDIYSLFHLRRPFKFISKTSNFLIPIVGWSMFLTGHIMLNRVDRRSQLKCLQTCIEMLSKGCSCLFFPEGTRSPDKVMGGFKKGAFSVAAKAGVPIVPVTLIGTGDVMPAGRESQMYGAPVKIVVHPMIQTKGKDADKVCEEARKAVASALPPQLVGMDSVTDGM